MKERSRTPRLALLTILIAACVPLLLLSADATQSMERGPAGEVEDAHPMLMSRWHDFPIDLTGDGRPEHVMVGGDGVVHAYTDDGAVLWITDTERIVEGRGLPINTAGTFFGPFQYLVQPAAAGPVWHDVDGDGVADLTAGMFLALDAPYNTLPTAIVTLSGADGAPIGFRLFDGIVRNLVLDDLTGDGSLDLFYTEEDGPQHTSITGTYTLGTGGSFTAHLSTRAGQPIWSKGFSEEWAHATTIEVGVFDGEGPDIALTLTGSFPKYQGFLDGRTTPFPETLYTLDGATGNIVWQTALPASYVREMHLVDLDGDLIEDVILRIQEPRNMHSSFTAGDDRARLMAYRGLDGAQVWDHVGIFGTLPVLHDSLVYDGSTLMLAYSEKGDAAYPGEDQERLAFFAVQDGRRLSDARLTTGVEVPPTFRSLFETDPVTTPRSASEEPAVRHMHLVVADEDAGRLVLGSNRGLMGLTVAGDGATVDWRASDAQVDRDLFYVLGSELWTQETGAGKMLIYSADDGALLREMSLMTLASGLIRVDVDGEGPKDRVVATATRQVLAFRGGSTEVLWRADVEEHVVDLVQADLTGDGREEVVVMGRLTIFALDSGDGTVIWRHDHGIVGQTAPWRLHDMDGDGTLDIVFGTRTSSQGSGASPAGIAQITYLDGKTGSVVWTRAFAAPAYEVGGIDIGDLNGDGQDDVAFVTQTITAALWYHVGALDGASGVPLWELEMPVRSGDNTLDSDGVIIADADGDGGLDVLVAMEGLQGTLTQVEPRLRAHDGLTGLELWTKPIDLGMAAMVDGIFSGAVGPNGTQAIVAMTDMFEQGWAVNILDPHGEEHLTVRFRGIAFFTDFKMGDVTGDGLDDLVIATPHGFTVLDTNASYAGNITYVGHATDWAASKTYLTDLDDDVALEVEFFSSQGNWPMYLGTRPYTDMARGKAIGTVDFDLGPVHPVDDTDPVDPEPVNEPPVATMEISSGVVYPGDAVQFTSTSTDTDGELVETSWTFSDGTIATGTSVLRSFPEAGSYSVTLQVTDDGGATDTTTGAVMVWSDRAFAIRQSRDGSHASPGEVVSYQVEVYNAGSGADTYVLSLEGPDIWTVAIDGDATVTVPAGVVHKWTVRVTVDAPSLREAIVATVASSESTQQRTHQVVVPLVISASLDDARATYGPLDTVGGTLQLTWRDGTPLEGVTVGVRENGAESAVAVVTGADGGASFTVAHDEAYRSPGGYSVRLDPSVPGYSTYRVLPFEVTLTG